MDGCESEAELFSDSSCGGEGPAEADSNGREQDADEQDDEDGEYWIFTRGRGGSEDGSCTLSDESGSEPSSQSGRSGERPAEHPPRATPGAAFYEKISQVSRAGSPIYRSQQEHAYWSQNDTVDLAAAAVNSVPRDVDAECEHDAKDTLRMPPLLDIVNHDTDKRKDCPPRRKNRKGVQYAPLPPSSVTFSIERPAGSAATPARGGAGGISLGRSLLEQWDVLRGQSEAPPAPPPEPPVVPPRPPPTPSATVTVVQPTEVPLFANRIAGKYVPLSQLREQAAVRSSSRQDGAETAKRLPSPASSDSGSNAEPEYGELGSTWGIPGAICRVYHEMGITSLFPWQRCLLEETKVLTTKENLVYCAPTSGGKTLVAELVMIRRLLESEGVSNRRKALFILPYVAIVTEKANYLSKLLEPAGLRVGTQAGGKGNRLMLDDVSVCTMERANATVNLLLEMGRLDEIAVVVVDEVHQIGDPERGYILEVMLAKILYATHHTIQIVGMSATLPNADLLAKWLRDGWFFATNFRPVPLKEFVSINGSVFTGPSPTPARTTTPVCPQDSDCLLALIGETVGEGHSVLIFCASKRSAETTATYVAQYLPVLSRKQHEASRSAAVSLLRASSYGMDPILEETVPLGVAYHHAGLTFEEREVVERAFRDGTISVLTCTTTLAAGVNLPARRVIFRTAKIGIEPLDAPRYKQAAGRAGRVGLDTVGESVLLGGPAEKAYLMSLITGKLHPARSSLREEGRGMSRALGEAIASGVVSSVYDVQRFVTSTFFATEAGYRPAHIATKSALSYLEEHDFISWDTTRCLFTPTVLGTATFSSGLSPEEASVVYEELNATRTHFVMSHDLHLLFHCTPIGVRIAPAWHVYPSLLYSMGPVAQEVAYLVGVDDTYLARARHQPPRGSAPADRLHCRFYASMILFSLIQEEPIAKVSAKFEVPRGSLQQLMESAASYSGKVAVFCEKLNWWGFAPLIQKLQVRIRDGVESDILPLMQIPNMKSYRARALYQAGYRTLACVAAAEAEDIERIVASAHPFQRAGKEDTRAHQQAADRRLARLMIKGAKTVLVKLAQEKEGEWQDASVLVGHVLGEGHALSALTMGLTNLLQGRLTGQPEAIRPGKRPRERVTVGAGFGKKVLRKDPPLPSRPSAPSDRPPLPPSPHRPPTATIAQLQEQRARGVVERPRPPMPSNDFSFAINEIRHADAGNDLEARFLSTWGASHSFAFAFHTGDRAPVTYTTTLPDPFGVAVCFDPSTTYYYSIIDSSAQEGSKEEAQRRWEVVKRRFSTAAVKVAFDCKRECKWLLGLGVRDPNPMADPRVAAWLINPEEKYEGSASNTLEVFFRQHVRNCTLRGSPSTGAQKACRTALQSHLLMAHFRGNLHHNNLLRAFTEVEMPFAVVVADLELRGVHFDSAVFRGYEKAMEEKAAALTLAAHRLTGYQWDLTSPQDCARALFDNQQLPEVEVRKVRPEEHGKKKRRRAETRSTSASVLAKLEVLRPECPLPAMIREHRTLVGWVAKYIRPIPNFAGPDQRVRSTVLLTATNTGRIAMLDPNLQTIPHPFTFHTTAGEPCRVELRCAFSPPNANYLLASVDYSQIEVRIMAHFSRDEALTRFLKEGGDVFRKVAGAIKNKPPEAVSGDERKIAKAICYGILYGKGPQSLAEDMDCDVDEAARFLQDFMCAYSGVAAYLKNVVVDCRKLGYIETVVGRRRYLPAIYARGDKERSFAERQAVNTICQGSAADIMKRAMVGIHSLLRDAGPLPSGERKGNMVLQIHDELLLEVHKDAVDEVLRGVVREMEGAVTLRVPLPVKIQIGSSWGDLRPYHLAT